jgi:hypothetical protein
MQTEVPIANEPFDAYEWVIEPLAAVRKTVAMPENKSRRLQLSCCRPSRRNRDFVQLKTRR